MRLTTVLLSLSLDAGLDPGSQSRETTLFSVACHV
jgi:hypothetical protein